MVEVWKYGVNWLNSTRLSKEERKADLSALGGMFSLALAASLSSMAQGARYSLARGRKVVLHGQHGGFFENRTTI